VESAGACGRSGFGPGFGAGGRAAGCWRRPTV